MSIRDAIALQELQRQTAMLGVLVEQLLLEQAEQVMRVAALEASASAECGACAARRSHDAARQRRLRHRHATGALSVQESASVR